MARVVLLIVSLLLYVSPVLGQAVWSDWQGGVWTMGIGRSIVQFGYDFGEGPFVSSIEGTTRPLVSPDQTHVAFSRENDLWILDLKTKKSVRATHLGRPETSTLAAVRVLVSLWASDGSKILYRVMPGFPADLEGEGPELKERKAKYGMYIYDLERSTSRPVKVPGEVRAWLPGGDFIVKAQTGDSFAGKLMRFHPGEPQGRGKVISDHSDDYVQLEVNPDGQRILTLIGDTRTGAQLIEIDLRTNTSSTIAKGKFAEVQWGKYSPTGKRISYVRGNALRCDGHGDELVVDGKTVFSMREPFYTYWIDDDTIALFVVDLSTKAKHEWVLIDLKSGTERSRTPIS